MEWVGVTPAECSQLKCVKPKMKGRKLRSAAYWQGALKQKGVHSDQRSMLPPNSKQQHTL